MSTPKYKMLCDDSQQRVCNTLPRSWYKKCVESSWNVMAHSNAWEGKWRRNWRMKWVPSTLHTTSERGISSITTADAHTSAAKSRLNWRPRRFKWTRPFRRKTKSGFCACAITFQIQSTNPGFQVVQANIFRTVAYDACESSAINGSILLFWSPEFSSIY